MTEDQLTRLFGDATIVQGALWILAIIALVVLIVKLWPALSNAVTLINLLARLAVRLDVIESKLEAVREQVQNSHETNLREEQDERHEEVVKRLDRLDGRLDGTARDIGRLDRRDILRVEETQEIRRSLATVETKTAAIDQTVAKHLKWSAQWSADIEDTLNPRKEQ